MRLQKYSVLLRYSGAQISGRIVCNVPFNSGTLDNAAEQKIKKLVAALYTDIENKRTHTIQRIVYSIIFGFGIRPFVRRQGSEYRGVTEKWAGMGIKI